MAPPPPIDSDNVQVVEFCTYEGASGCAEGPGTQSTSNLQNMEIFLGFCLLGRGAASGRSHRNFFLGRDKYVDIYLVF